MLRYFQGTILFILFYSFSSAQCGIWDYSLQLVDKEGDTIRVFVPHKDYIELENRNGVLIYKRPEGDCKKEQKKIKEIEKIIRGVDEYYPVWVDYERQFLKRVFDDSVKLYQGAYVVDGYWSASPPSPDGTLRSNTYVSGTKKSYSILEYGGEVISVPKRRKRFNKIISKFFSKNKSLAEDIKNGKYYTFQIKKILEIYCDGLRIEKKYN